MRKITDFHTCQWTHAIPTHSHKLDLLFPPEGSLRPLLRTRWKSVEHPLSMADGPPEWVWTKGFKCFQQGVVDHLEEEEERGEQKHLSKGAKLTPKNPHQFNKCQRALLGIRYHKSGFPACLKRWPSKCEKGGLTRLDWTKSAFRAYKGNGDKACTETLVLLEMSGTKTAKSSRSKSRTNSGKHGTRQEQSPVWKLSVWRKTCWNRPACVYWMDRGMSTCVQDI